MFFKFYKWYQIAQRITNYTSIRPFSYFRKMLKQDRRSEPRIGERVPYVVIHGSPGLPLIQLVKRFVV